VSNALLDITMMMTMMTKELLFSLSPFMNLLQEVSLELCPLLTSTKQYFRGHLLRGKWHTSSFLTGKKQAELKLKTIEG